ncbi:MAG: hypothetical protein ACOYM3_09865 [Terrimicrobiaceae bacterium]
MKCSPDIWTARSVTALTLSLLIFYLFRVGPERFYIESFGTWIISPVIYPRLLPSPWNAMLIKVLVYAPWTSFILQSIPVLLLLGATTAAVVSIVKDSLVLACLAMGLTGLVFGVYHCLQPLGITLVLF